MNFKCCGPLFTPKMRYLDIFSIFYNCSLGHKSKLARGKKCIHNEALKKNDLECLKYRQYAKNMNRKSRWAVTAYVDWHNDLIQRVGPQFCDTCVLKCDLLKPRLLDQDDFCKAMCKFVTEV